VLPPELEEESNKIKNSNSGEEKSNNKNNNNSSEQKIDAPAIKSEADAD
jgi:hypothetical protein